MTSDLNRVTIYGPSADLASITIKYHENSDAIPLDDPSINSILKSNNGRFYKIYYFPRYNQTLDELNQILSTFKFIE